MADKNIIVSGASSGIGRAISTRLLQQGYRVTGVARDFSKFPCDDQRFTPVCMDLSDLDELPARLDALIKKDSVIDGLICCHWKNSPHRKFASCLI